MLMQVLESKFFSNRIFRYSYGVNNWVIVGNNEIFIYGETLYKKTEMKQFIRIWKGFRFIRFSMERS